MTGMVASYAANAAEFLALGKEMERVKKLEGGTSFLLQLFEAIAETAGLTLVDKADAALLTRTLSPGKEGETFAEQAARICNEAAGEMRAANLGTEDHIGRFRWAILEARIAAALTNAVAAGRAGAFEEAGKAVLSARYGPPSMWGAPNPRGWHLQQDCTPTDASMHDNGVIDAYRALRQRALSEPAGDGG